VAVLEQLVEVPEEERQECSTRCSRGSASGNDADTAAIDIVPPVSLEDDVRAELRELAAQHRLRVPRILDGAQGPFAVLDGRAVVNFASNDYLGLAGDARLGRAAPPTARR
jgi:hypothetical protein